MLDKEEELLSRQQQKSLHLFCRLLADELNGAGLDMKVVLKPSIDISWTKDNIKEYIWKPIMYSLYQKKSTTKLLKKSEIDGVWKEISRHLADKLGFTCPPFPSEEEILNQQRDE